MISRRSSQGEHDGNRQCNRRDQLLDQPAQRLDHVQAVGCLHARPLQAIVEDGVFVREQVQAGRVLHYSHADVVHILPGQQGIGVVDPPSYQALSQRQRKLRGNQPPQIMRDRLMVSNNLVDGVDDELRYPEQGNGQQRSDDSSEQSGDDHRPPGFPHVVQDRRHIT
jgi:hypothetical protein